MLKRIIVLVLIVLVWACKGFKEEKIIPVDDFFKTQDKAYYRISPDGKSLSYLKLRDKKLDLFVENLASGSSVQLTHLTDKSISFYFWTSNNELVYYTEDDSNDRKSDLFVINKDGSRQVQLSSNEKTRLRVIEDQLIDDKYIIVASNKRDSTVFDVYRLNVRNGKMDIAAKNPGNVTEWMTDNKGVLKIAVASDGVNETLFYRENESQPFSPVITNNFETTLQPIAFSEDEPNVLFAISNVNRDKNALVALDLKTGKEKQVLFANDTLNVVDAKYSRTKRKMIFVTCETWKKNKFYLDESTKQTYTKIEKLLPGSEWRIMDKDKADGVFVVRTFTDRNPGSYYLYTASQNKLKKLTDINSSIKEEDMSEMKPICYKSKDGLKINGYLTLPKGKKATNLPLVVVPHNGPGLRNSWGYNADVQFLANRGYAVLQVNYRGSSGYGKAFYAAGLKQWSDKIQEDVNDGVKWLVAKKIVNPKKVAIYGNGLGGYIALNCLYKNPDIYACGGSNSGVINLFSYLKTIPPFLKSNLQMYYEIVGNPVTDTEYMRFASPVFHADRFKSPVFIAQNPKDPRVNVAEGVQFIKELKKRNVPVTYIEKEEGPNWVIRQQSRTALYKALEEFLHNNLNKR
ncbi:S9 family peptidase [Pedobacter rhizosphaerae]|uniref:Dipeptidyl aminopeptidase/acylaminoacyl peptidase n=1 Tax=Pedobacter rhizosphaerae TaxID=390241 RepID=A0A1H9RST1_9SPHI|nr:prolyl oligopeptidase family serine peptidase [Pedobacter rhizosphaerae]SER75193.1 Dipeptidyl aminopeptidase/acylaminoacyl peptidase [Pedobacter rhizosphaerae]